MKGKDLKKSTITLPNDTMIGALSAYISDSSVKKFQPMGANFGVLPELENRPRDKKEYQFTGAHSILCSPYCGRNTPFIQLPSYKQNDNFARLHKSSIAHRHNAYVLFGVRFVLYCCIPYHFKIVLHNNKRRKKVKTVFQPARLKFSLSILLNKS